MRDRVAIRRHSGLAGRGKNFARLPSETLPASASAMFCRRPKRGGAEHVGAQVIPPAIAAERTRPSSWPVRALRSSASAIGAILLGTALACDAENLQERLQQAIVRQSGRGERQAAREAAKASYGRTGLPEPIVAALDLIAESDAVFIVKKDKKKDRTYSGFNFAAMLTTKTIWLGRGIDDLDLWIEEIASGSFMNRESYQVRRPDGVNEELTSWLTRQITSRPLTAEEREAVAEAAAEAQAEAEAGGRRRSSSRTATPKGATKGATKGTTKGTTKGATKDGETR